jgi:hypothetical protein
MTSFQRCIATLVTVVFLCKLGVFLRGLTYLHGWGEGCLLHCVGVGVIGGASASWVGIGKGMDGKRVQT